MPSRKESEDDSKPWQGPLYFWNRFSMESLDGSKKGSATQTVNFNKLE